MTRWPAHRLSLLVAPLLVCSLAGACRDSRVARHVPPPADFERLLQRDLAADFSRRLGRPVHVRHELLRAGPTLPKGGYPTYYAWVRVESEGHPALEGALAVRAVARLRFQVAEFVAASEARRDPDLLGRLFPRAVADAIRARLRL